MIDLGNSFQIYLSEIFEFWGADAVQKEIASEHELENLISMLSGNKAPNPFYSLTRSEDKTEAAEKVRLSVSNRKAWLKNIFVEGKGRVAREAFSAGDGKNDWYPRFNLGPYSSGADVWYSRFLYNTESDDNVLINNVLRNKEEAILRLAGKDDQRYKDGNINDSTYKSPIGLPFLRRIGSRSQMGAFSNVGHLRKQIAANLNDYCDDDSIPTSDKPADTWITDDVLTSNPPKYTGNEATPYINEIGFGFLIKNPKFNQGEKYTFSAEAQSEAWVELIKVYRNMIPKLIASYGFTGKITDLELVLKVTIGGKATFFEKVNEGGQEVEKAFLENKEFDDVSAESSGVFASNTAPFELSIKKGDFSGNGPYWLKNIPLPTTVSLNADFTDGIKKKAADGSVFEGKDISKIEVELSKIKIEISKVKFNLGNLVLYDASGSSKIGVDFVTVEKEGSPREVAPGITLCDGGKDEFNEAFAPNNAIIAFAGGMEAIDPRQNLNARSVQDKMNDWRNVDKPSFAYVPVKGKAQHHFPVDTWKWDDPSTRVTGGSVNDSSNPNVPKYADGTEIASTNRDKEETADPADPAWWGEEKEKHISTAVIRNAPMRSPWELGFIHRGIPFQTINLKKAGGIDDTGTFPADKPFELSKFNDWGDEAVPDVNSSKGTKYENGDGGILEQVKMTELGKAYGKLDLSTLRKDSESWWKEEGAQGLTLAGLNKALFRALFEGIRRQTPAQFLEESEFVDKVPVKVDTDPAWKGTLLTSNPVDDSNFSFTSSILDSAFRTNSFINGMNALLTGGENDAAQEELIGKTINLVEGRSNSVPNTFKIIVVAQTIRDMDGPVTKLDEENNPQSKSGAKHGVFDADINSDREKSIHYDDILSETRMLVTVERVNYMEGDYPRARLRVKQIEYLD